MMTQLMYQLRTPHKKATVRNISSSGILKLIFFFTTGEKNVHFRKNALYLVGGGESPSS